MIGLALAAMLFAALGLWAWQQRSEAVRNARQALNGFAAYLAEKALGSLATDPELGVLLALEAGRATASQGEPVVPAADQALRRALTESGGVLLTVPEGQYIRSLDERHGSPVVLSPDQRWLAATGEFSSSPSDRSYGVRLSRLNAPALESEVLANAEPPWSSR